MKLRDKIALEILKIFVATEAQNKGIITVYEEDFEEDEYLNETRARGAYAYADTMLRVRGENNNEH